MAATMRQSALQRLRCGVRQLRRAVRRDLLPRVEREELRDVPVSRLILVEIDRPLLQLAMFADALRE